VTLPSTYTGITAIEIGASGADITLNKPVRFSFAGDGGSQGFVAFFKRPTDTQATIITTQCTADNLATVTTQLGGSGECVFNDGTNLIIWTTHFTSFGTASSVTTSAGDSANTNAPSVGEPSVANLGNAKEGFGGTLVVDPSSGKTTTAKVGDKLVFRFNLYEDQGINNIGHAELILDGDKQSTLDNISITFDKNKPVQITDPKHVLANATFAILERDAYNFVLKYEATFTKALDTSDIKLVAWDLDRNSAIKSYPDALRVIDLQEELKSSPKINEVTYDVCRENMVRILVASPSQALKVDIKTTQSGTITATLAKTQPYEEQNALTSTDLYLYEAPLSSQETHLTITVINQEKQLSVSTDVEITQCSETPIKTEQAPEFVAQENVPKIFDIKAKLGNKTLGDSDYIGLDNKKPMTISAIIDGASNATRSELRLVTLGQSDQDYHVIQMSMTPLISNSVFVATGVIPAELLQSPGISYWIFVENPDSSTLSAKKTIGIEQKNIDATIELDIPSSVPKEKMLRSSAYVKNNVSVPLLGTVTIMIDGRPTSQSQLVLQPGQTKIDYEWYVPKETMSHKASAKLQIYGYTTSTNEVSFNSFQKIKTISLNSQKELTQIKTSDGKIIANVGLIYASDHDQSKRLHVTAPDGTCVIGSTSECLVKDSTFGKRGNAETITLGDQVYRVRYSGYDNPIERFSIVSVDPIVGNWHVDLESDNGIIPEAQASSDVEIKLQYRPETREIITAK
jgi:hypothetical protein